MKRLTGILQAVPIRWIMMLAASACVIGMGVVFTAMIWAEQRSAIYQSADRSLLAAAMGQRAMLGQDYFDRISGPDSISSEEWQSIVVRNDELCRRLGLQYVWSVLVLDHRIVFTSATHTNLKDPASSCAAFFETHTDPASYAAVVNTRKPAYSTFHNKWGEGRMILFPESDTSGRLHIYGASIQLTALDQILQATLRRTAAYSLAFLAAALLLVAIVSKLLTRPIIRLLNHTREMAWGNLDDEITEPLASKEINALAHSIESMRSAIASQMDQIRRSEIKFRSYIDYAPIGVFVITQTGAIRDANYALGHITGFTRSELITMKITDLMPKGFLPEEREQHLRIGLTELSIKELPYQRKNGTVGYCRIEAVLLADQHVLGFAIDITQKRSQDEQIRQLNEGLERKVEDRTAELHSFLYSVAHDLRAPVRHVNGFAQMLAEDYDAVLDENAQELIERIISAARLQDDLMDGLLALSRITTATLHCENVDVSELAASILDELQENDSGRTVKTRIQSGISVWADRRLMRILLENLLGNAWKYTIGREPALIEIGMEEFESKRLLFVRDNGAGFDMKYADQLFTVFRRFHSAKEFSGNGIGLSIVQRIVRQHDWHIWAASEVGRGTVFRIAL